MYRKTGYRGIIRWGIGGIGEWWYWKTLVSEDVGIGRHWYREMVVSGDGGIVSGGSVGENGEIGGVSEGESIGE